ncbi:MAG: type II secretion system protein GspM [Rhizomicrobium sp.]
MRPLEPRERQIVALGILVLALVIVWFGLIQPVIGGFIGRAQERSELTGTYKRNAHILAASPRGARRRSSSRRRNRNSPSPRRPRYWRRKISSSA